MKRHVPIFFLALFLLAGNGYGADAVSTPDPYAYHLRIVRVVGMGTNPGAALGWSENGGIPVMQPSEEAWGTPEQLDALARTLGGNHAEAVTGFFATASEAGVRFERRVYLGKSLLDLSFEALPPASPGGQHELFLELDSPEATRPLAEARLLVRTERTVAIASPSPEGDWLVLAVTLVDQSGIEELRGSRSGIRDPDSAGVKHPQIIRKTEPSYPEAARRNGVRGSVVLMAVVDRDGIPRSPMVLEMSPGAEELAAAAVEAVKTWRYEPATLDGNPVDVFYRIHVEFKLQ